MCEGESVKGKVILVWEPPQGLPHNREPKNAEWTTDKKKIVVMGHRELNVLSASLPIKMG